jgi:outer membrane immunogenic protein
MRAFIGTVLLSAVAIASPSMAEAADLSILKAPAPAPAPIPPFTWSGFYVGVHGGAGFGTKTFDYNDLTLGAPFLWDSSVPINGPLAGGQVGLAWQADWFVLGIEADGSWADISGHGFCNTTNFFLNCSATTSALGTVTGRLGAAIDKALIYAKGGAAWARDRLSISNVALPPSVTAFSSSLSDTRVGWTLGLGVEYMLLPCWSVKVEYDYVDFGTKRYDFSSSSTVVAPETFTNWDVSQRLHVMTIGVNYRLDYGSLPAAY